MRPYNVLNEVDYYPRSKFAEPLNPFYGNRKENVNTFLAEIMAYSPTSLTASYWIGNAWVVLRFPKWNEDEMFASAAEELSRLSREVHYER